MVIDRHVSAVEVAGFAEAVAERKVSLRGGIGRPGGDERYRRHRLLCPRTKRPRRRATDPAINSRRRIGVPSSRESNNPNPIIRCPMPLGS